MTWKNSIVAAVTTLASVTSQSPAEAPVKPQPINFDAVDRTIGAVPDGLSEHAEYGLFLFGTNGEKRVWAVFDRSLAGSEEGERCPDRLFIDLDADGTLGEDGECFEAKSTEGEKTKRATFEIGDFVDPATGAQHSDWVLTWTAASVRFKMTWRGVATTMGCYGPTRDTYASFGDSPAEAPIFVPGWDRPFEFEHWMSGTLRRGHEKSFKVYLGNRGDRVGAFTCVKDKFLPQTEHVLATLIYKDRNGKEQLYQSKLTERC